MLWSESVSGFDAIQEADLVLEGKIAHVYQDVLPWTEGEQRIIGYHFLFDHKPKVIRSSPFGGAIHRDLPDIGFWSYPQHLICKVGDSVRVALNYDLRPNKPICLQPAAASNSVVDAISGKNLNFYSKENFKAPFRGDKINDMPLKWAFLYDGESNDPQSGRLWGGDNSEAYLAYKVWAQAWSSDPKVKFDALWIMQQPPVYDTSTKFHYAVATSDLGPYPPVEALY